MTDGDGMYTLGIDLGTTFSAAAVWRGGHAEISGLGSRAAAIPSVVLLREDASVLTGDAANRRATSEPHRVAREFKRRIGDTTPVLLAGTPYSAEALTARLLKAIIEQVTSAEGGPPQALVLSHPANWGPYKTDLLAQAVRIADVEVPVSYVSEPEAAAVLYATQQRVPAGSVVAVYDLGGGTFDAAVLRRTADGFEVLGQPEGIERLGGVDVDAAVFDHVARALGGKLEELDEDDPAAATAVARLRAECVDAKEALSSDTDVSIPVILPNVSTDVRLTRSELEAMVGPALQDTIDALRRALRAAEVGPEDLDCVLLVGGASRMPLVSQLVGAEIGRPVAVDAHPKNSVALGAAWLAAIAAGEVEPLRAPVEQEQHNPAAPPTTSSPPPAPMPAPRSSQVPGAAVPAAAAAGVVGAAAVPAAAAGPPVAAPAPAGGARPNGPPITGPQRLHTGQLPPLRPNGDTGTHLLPPGGRPPPSAGSAAYAVPPARSRPAFVPDPATSERPRTRARVMLVTAAAAVAVGGIALAAPQFFGVAPAGNASPVTPVVATSTTAVPATTTTVVPTTPEPAPAPAPETRSDRRTTRDTRPAQRQQASVNPAPVNPAPVNPAPVNPAPVKTETQTVVVTVTDREPPEPSPQPTSSKTVVTSTEKTSTAGSSTGGSGDVQVTP
jgi:actin-like ATPase involved in cell morphogenesis